MRTSDDGAAHLAHLHGKYGVRVSLRSVSAGPASAAAAMQHRYLHGDGRHGDAVADRDCEGVIVLAGEAGVAVKQRVAGHVGEGEDVA